MNSIESLCDCVHKVIVSVVCDNNVTSAHIASFPKFLQDRLEKRIYLVSADGFEQRIRHPSIEGLMKIKRLNTWTFGGAAYSIGVFADQRHDIIFCSAHQGVECKVEMVLLERIFVFNFHIRAVLCRKCQSSSGVVHQLFQSSQFQRATVRNALFSVSYSCRCSKQLGCVGCSPLASAEV